MDLVQKGSQTAKDGFRNEQDICDKFNNWEVDNEAKQLILNVGTVEIKDFTGAVWQQYTEPYS